MATDLWKAMGDLEQLLNDLDDQAWKGRRWLDFNFNLVDPYVGDDLAEVLQLIISRCYEPKLTSMANDALKNCTRTKPDDTIEYCARRNTVLRQIYIIIGAVLSRTDVAPKDTKVYLAAKVYMQQVYQLAEGYFYDPATPMDEGRICATEASKHDDAISSSAQVKTENERFTPAATISDSSANATASASSE